MGLYSQGYVITKIRFNTILRTNKLTKPCSIRSHLLLHDDSISTRVVSYILYLPNNPPTSPSTSDLTPSADGTFLKGWNPAWGGVLELYPIEGDETKDVGPPAVKRSEKVGVKWGNLVFFEVQPGKR